MANKRSRDRQLAKKAVERQAERHRSQRRRNLLLGAVGAVVAIALVFVGFNLLFGGEDEVAGPDPTATPSPSVGGLPEQTGTVSAEAAPAETVACGASRPDAADEPKPQFDRAPSADEVLEPDTVYVAVLTTSCGTIEVELRSRQAPTTVASFVFLAQQGYFDGQFFHRVVDSIDVVQGGDPLGTGTGGPGYSIPDELAGGETYEPGTVAMAKSSAPNSGGSQFFLITGPEGAALDLNPNYTIFGKMIAGLDVAKVINALMPSAGYDGAPTEAVYIESVTIREEPAA